MKMKLFWIIWFYQNNLNLDNYNPKCPCCLWRLKKDTYAMHIHTILEKSWLINVLHNPSSMIISLRPCIKFLLSYVFTTIHAPYSILHICILHLYWEPVRCRLASLCQFKLDKGYDLLAKIKGIFIRDFKRLLIKVLTAQAHTTLDNLKNPMKGKLSSFLFLVLSQLSVRSRFSS